MTKVMGNLSLTEKKALAKNTRAFSLEKYKSILDNIKDTDTFIGDDPTSFGFYQPSLGTSYLTNSDSFGTAARRLSTAIHEVGSHQALKGDKNMPVFMQEELTKSFLPKNRLLEMAANSSDPLSRVAAREADNPYLTNPAEIHARILQTRLHSGKFPQGELTWEDFQNATMALEKGKFLNPLDPDFTKLVLDPARFVKTANKYAAGLPLVPALNNKQK